MSGHDEHTPGPWTMPREVPATIYGPDGYQVATLPRTNRGRVEREANARILMSAPSMLSALEELLAEFDADSDKAAQEPGCGGLNETGGIVLARAAIAKARGEVVAA